MARIRANANKTTEVRLARIMRRFRITGWRRGSRLLGRPDFVFPRARLVIFVDGDFWHGHPRRFKLPKSNVGYWRSKIERNKMRDRAVTEELTRIGWNVLRIWECDLRDEEVVAAQITLELASSSGRESRR
jgi:DNA mismatch endonuclease (patch repair protein)